jgi:hypothetical protein|tara:strand:+ start:892 stop:1260 length:369 start_codon:yes stop_codon:yes gene_type:complete
LVINTQKTTINFIGLLLIIWACPEVIIADNQSPCEDSVFVELKKRDLDSMSDREYTYFMEYNKRCEKFQKEKKREESIRVINEPKIEKIPTEKDRESYRYLIDFVRFVITYILIEEWIDDLF